MSQQPTENLEQAHRPDRIRARLEHGARGEHVGAIAQAPGSGALFA